MSAFSVIEFLGEDSVEAVPSMWIEKLRDTLYCYWPSINAAKRARKQEMPDKETWGKFKIRVLSKTGDYCVAAARARRAEETSNVESDEYTSSRRKRKRINSDFEDFSEDDAADESFAIKQPKKKIPPALPKPPVFSSSRSCPSRNPSPTVVPQCTIEETDSHSPCVNASVRSCSGPCPSRNDGYPNSRSPSCLLGNSSGSMETQSIEPNPGLLNGLETSFLPDLGDIQGMLQVRPSPPERNESPAFDLPSQRGFQGTPKTTQPGKTVTSFSMRRDQQEMFQRSVLTKLETIIQKQDEGLSLLRMLLGATKVDGNDILEDLLPQPLDNVQELMDLNTRLGDEQYTKKMINFMAAVCGHSIQESVRRIMAKLGTNKLWSLYSLKGRKGKSSFKELTICKLVIRSCIRAHKKVSEIDVEEQIAEVLKHAPHRSGGAKYKNREVAED